MTWYAAHAILSIRFRQGEQQSYPVYENVYLIEATDAHQAAIEGASRAKEDEGDSSGTLTWEGRPAFVTFAGLRKVVLVSHQAFPERLGAGDEITYSQFDLPDEASLQRLVSGHEVVVTYAE